MKVGGDRIYDHGYSITPTAGLLTVKLLFNSVIITTNDEFITLCIKIFYLNNTLARYKKIRLKMIDLLEDIIEEYKLRVKLPNKSSVYVDMHKGMYGFPHSGFIAQKTFEGQWHKYGYHKIKYTLGLWMHAFQPN